jgi:hypothetical protein
MLLLVVHAPCVASTDSSAREDRVLLFYMENEEYLLPFIEQTLTELSHAYYSGSLFSEVLNLNAYEDDIRYQKTVRSLIDYYSGTSTVLKLPDEARNVHDTIAQGLMEYDLFLKIKVHVLNELLEYQFMLYETIPAVETGRDLTVQDLNRYHRARTVFIDPRQPDYLNDLKNTIKQIFPECNQPPIPVVKVNGRRNEGAVVHRFALGDTLVLDASLSIDRDSPRSAFSYEWRQIDTLGRLNVSIHELVPLKQNSVIQKLEIDKPGDYMFGVKVSDGILYSREDTVRVKIVERPRLRLLKKELSHVSQQSILTSPRNRPPIYIGDELGVEVIGSLDSDAVFLVRSFDSSLINAVDIDQPEWDPSKQRLFAQITVVPKSESDQGEDTTWSGRPLQTLYSRRNEKYHYSFTCDVDDSLYALKLKGILPDGRYRLLISVLQGGVESHPAILNIATRCRSPLQFGFRTGYFSVTMPDSTDSEERRDEDGTMWALFARVYLWKGLEIEISRFFSYHTDTDWRLGGTRLMGKLQYSLNTKPWFQMMPSLNFLKHSAFAWSESGSVMCGLGCDLELKFFRHLSIEFGFHVFIANWSSRDIGGNLITVGVNLDLPYDNR